MFSTSDVADYYNQTQNHYEKWWGLRQNHSLHYGIWYTETKTFSEALANTKIALLEKANIKSSDHVLDAGCGVGGGALFIHQNSGAHVTGITLSTKQLQYGQQLIEHNKCSDKIKLEIADYTQTPYPASSFDVVWACESISSAIDERDFLKEAHRLLKPGGRLVLCDYFMPNKNINDPKQLMKKWLETWSINQICGLEEFKQWLEEYGFDSITVTDFSREIQRTSRIMYRACIFGSLPSIWYNLTHKNVTRFAKHHYKSGIYQYKTLQKGFWKYMLIAAIKP